MLASENSKERILEEMSQMTVEAQKDLELARQELDEKQILLEELAETSNKKIKEAAKANNDLKSKVDFLFELSANLNEENKKLQESNQQLSVEKERYNKLSAKLKKDFENLVVREKQLELQRKQLSIEVEQKSKALAMNEKMATVGQLSSRLAHDLRNPLTIIKNSVEILHHNNKNIDSNTAEKYSLILRATKKIAYQIDDVLDFVRQSELHLKRKPVSEIIDSSISNILIPNTVTINRDYRNVVINCDSRKLEAVFSNIITNAIQAMNEKGKIDIKIFENEDGALIKISDSGPGIRKSAMERLFEPLFTTKETGTGLGLSICKNIIEQHGGTISASSPPTTFSLNIPKNLRGFYKATDEKLQKS